MIRFICSSDVSYVSLSRNINSVNRQVNRTNSSSSAESCPALVRPSGCPFKFDGRPSSACSIVLSVVVMAARRTLSLLSCALQGGASLCVVCGEVK